MVSSIFFQFLLLISILWINQSHSIEFDEVVNVTVYYQSARPHVRNLPFPLFDALQTLFRSDIMEVVKLRLVPYGNAVTNGNATVKCPDGPTQCFYNTIEACALDEWPVKTSFPFILCAELEHPNEKTKQRIWRSCMMKIGLDPKPIEDCYTSGYGNYLLIHNGLETKLINPPHDKLPWILVNWQHIPDMENLVFEVCKAYTGHTQFTACQEMVGTTPDEKLISSSIVSS